MWHVWRRLRLKTRSNNRQDRPRRILLVAPHSSYRISPYLEAARHLGIPLLIISEGEHSLVSEVAEGLHVDFSDPQGLRDKVLAAASDYEIAAVIGCDDATVETAAQLANTLGLRHNKPGAVQFSRRKDLARMRLREVGVAVPAFRVFDRGMESASQLQNIDYPCVLKPVALSGSRGVIRADDEMQLLAAIRRTGAIVDAEMQLPEDERSLLLIETFVPGPEYALEGMLDNGKLQVLSIFDKPDPLEGPFFEETYYIAPSRAGHAVQQALADCVAEACKAYGLAEGPVHAELRWHDGKPWVMEVAARTIGGQCARLLQLAAGRQLEELVLLQAMGKELPPMQLQGGAGVLMIPVPRSGLLRRVEGQAQALKVPGVRDLEISVQPGYELRALPEGASYLGFIFAVADTPDQAEQVLREAHAKLKVVTAPVLPVMT